MTAWGIVFPFDTLKSAAQVAGTGKRVPMSITPSWATVRLLYRGCPAALMRAFPANAALFAGQSVAYDALGRAGLQ